MVTGFAAGVEVRLGGDDDFESHGLDEARSAGPRGDERNRRKPGGESRSFRITLAVIGQGDAGLVAAPRAPARGSSSRADCLWGALGIGAALGLALWMNGFAIDDALISVRYARHLAEGMGYRFNVDGPSTDGVTPLPWPFLLAPLARAPALVVLARAKALALAAWLAAAGGWGIAVGRAGARVEAKVAATLLLGACLPLGAHAMSGMETGVALALATAAALASGPWTTCALAGATALLRPEMVVWSLVLGLGVGPTRRAIPRALLAIAPSVACAVLRAAVFGRPAPLAVLAKPSDLAHGIPYAAAAALVSLAPVVLLAPLAIARTRGRAAAIALAGAAHFAVIAAVGGDWMPYARLAAPIIPGLLYAFVLASPQMSRLAAAGRFALSCSVAAYVLVRAAPAGRHVRSHVEALVRAAEPALRGARRIAALDVGWPTAASEASIVDLAGLTDPDIAALPGGHTSKRVDPAMLLARDPDAILLYWHAESGERVYWRAVEARLADSELIARHYEARASLPSYGEDDAGYVVLWKRSP